MQDDTKRDSPRSARPLTLTIVAAMAAAIVTGCSQNTRRCVDASGRPIPDVACRASGGSGYSYPHYIYTRGSSWNRSTSWGGSQGTSGSTVRGGFGGFHGFGGG